MLAIKSISFFIIDVKEQMELQLNHTNYSFKIKELCCDIEFHISTHPPCIFIRYCEYTQIWPLRGWYSVFKLCNQLSANRIIHIEFLHLP